MSSEAFTYYFKEKMLEEELLPSAVNREKPQLTVETDFCDSELQNFVTKLKQDIITEDNEPPQGIYWNVCTLWFVISCFDCCKHWLS